MQVKIAFRRAGTIRKRHIDLIEAVQSAGPPFRGPGLVQRVNGSVLALQPYDESLPIGFGIRHVTVTDFIVIADRDNRRIVGIVLHHRFGEDADFTDVVRVADVIHIALGRRHLLPILGNDIDSWISPVQPDRSWGTWNIQDHPNPIRVHLLQNCVEPCELERTLLRLERIPGEITHPYDVKACLLHQGDVAINLRRTAFNRLITRPHVKLSGPRPAWMRLRTLSACLQHHGRHQTRGNRFE